MANHPTSATPPITVHHHKKPLGLVNKSIIAVPKATATEPTKTNRLDLNVILFTFHLPHLRS